MHKSLDELILAERNRLYYLEHQARERARLDALWITPEPLREVWTDEEPS